MSFESKFKLTIFTFQLNCWKTGSPNRSLVIQLFLTLLPKIDKAMFKSIGYKALSPRSFIQHYGQRHIAKKCYSRINISSNFKATVNGRSAALSLHKLTTLTVSVI